MHHSSNAHCSLGSSNIDTYENIQQHSATFSNNVYQQQEVTPLFFAKLVAVANRVMINSG
jgi:uncharacterized membrane-anchored protein YhcB (DUF1043 family)